jgi:hypothetical protein
VVLDLLGLGEEVVEDQEVSHPDEDKIIAKLGKALAHDPWVEHPGTAARIAFDTIAEDYYLISKADTEASIVAVVAAAETNRPEPEEGPPVNQPSQPRICPECGEPAVQSSNGMVRTAMASMPHFDEDGTEHLHDPNNRLGIVGNAWMCSHGHWFSYARPTCHCGWPTGGNKHFVRLDWPDGPDLGAVKSQPATVRVKELPPPVQQTTASVTKLPLNTPLESPFDHERAHDHDVPHPPAPAGPPRRSRQARDRSVRRV